ncbi:MAG TPA: hypothetical protein VJ184_05660, partial [Chryseolinea sp.]|nr:hypothetical protein [Chryseolinea sp.]
MNLKKRTKKCTNEKTLIAKLYVVTIVHCSLFTAISSLLINHCSLIIEIMFRHNVILIYRNFKRFKSTFFINLIGLSTGLACTLLIYLWVNDEWNVDKFHEKESQLFRVMLNDPSSEGIKTSPSTQA